MSHQAKILAGGVVFYGVGYVCANIASKLGINAADFALRVAPLSALLSCFLFYSLMLVERLYATSSSIFSRLIQTWVASLFSAAALSLSVSINIILIAMALFTVARLVFSDSLIDEEASRRKSQVLQEFGLNAKSSLPFWALLVVFMGVTLVLWAWHRA